MRIVLVRHGESEFNRANKDIANDHLYIGQSNSKLTEKGKQSATALRQNIYVKQIQTVYASDLFRAIETAKLATQCENIVISKDLRERSLGLFEGERESVLKVRYPEIFKDATNYEGADIRNSFDVRVPGGENLTEVCIRCLDFLKTIDLKQDMTIGLFSHSQTIRCLIYVLTGLTREDALKLKIRKCEPIVLSGKKVGDFALEFPAISELEEE